MGGIKRRMISSRVTETTKFLRLKPEAQALYFHLLVNTDDDGIVEAFRILRMVGFEDYLDVLEENQLITILDKEDLIVFVNDFLEHNKIRKDRKIDSIYQNLLPEGTEIRQSEPSYYERTKKKAEIIILSKFIED